MVRDATSNDAAAIQAIYAPYVTDTAISFETDVPSVQDMARRIEHAIAWLVCERDGELVGYAYAGPFHTRAAYAWSSEVSIYVDGARRRAGVGRELLRALLDRLERVGVVNAIAGIALPNDASQGLFESFGFERAATYQAIGYKLDRWHDVGWWQLRLHEPTVPPPPLPDRRTTA
jgi:phosphinothricin acetyltransferase